MKPRSPHSLLLLALPGVFAGLAGAQAEAEDGSSSVPLSLTASWSVESNQASAELGQSVAGAGDVNGDGYMDVIVGAWAYSNGALKEGRAFVFHGSAGGLSRAPDWFKESNVPFADFGWSVACAGDVNGDGYDDVIVGARRLAATQPSEGRAYVFHGSPTGLGLGAAWTAESNQQGALFGVSVSSAGDVNGDGYDDVIVGAEQYGTPLQGEGRAFVYHGSHTGLSATADWFVDSPQMSSDYGRSVSSAGDVNGDGYDDVVVGAPKYDQGQMDEGHVFVYHGSAAGLSTTADWTRQSNAVNANFGRSVSCAGDVNGDGYSDLIVGSSGANGGPAGEGQAFVYHGSPAGLANVPAWTGEGNLTGAQFGYAVSGAGDINGDGFDDIVVGAHRYENGEPDEGRAYAYLGSSAGVQSTPAWSVEGDQIGARLGASVAGAGDVDGDGFDDVIVGAPFFDGPEADEGLALVFQGNASGGPVSYCTAGLSANGCQATLLGSGVASSSAPSGFSLTAIAVEGQKDGLFYFAANGRQAAPWGTGSSFQCVTPPIQRAGLSTGTGTAGSCDGSFTQDLNALWCPACPKPNLNPGAGVFVQAQLWYRDPLNTSNQTTSLSDAIEFAVGP